MVFETLGKQEIRATTIQLGFVQATLAIGGADRGINTHERSGYIGFAGGVNPYRVYIYGVTDERGIHQRRAWRVKFCDKSAIRIAAEELIGARTGALVGVTSQWDTRPSAAGDKSFAGAINRDPRQVELRDSAWTYLCR